MTRFRYSSRAWRLFDLGFGPRRKLGFRRSLTAGLPRGSYEGGPLLLVSNHVSWWDGFILHDVHQKVRPKKALYIVMLERELAKRPFLKRLGGVGFDPESTSSLRSLLRDLKELRSRTPEFSVLFFPQGRIWPSFRRPLGFRGGVRLVAESLAPVAVLPLGIHLESGNQAAPAAFVSMGEVTEGPGTLSVDALEEAVEGELDAIHHFLATHGEDAEDRWPGPGDRLPRAQEGAH
jgi:1-acyl-sn-glycerol-3-phosphate acyltransferase